MLKTFFNNLNLRIHYRTNCILFSLKSLPLIKKVLPDSLYSNGVLKSLAFVVGVIHEITMTFIGKALYLLVIMAFAKLVGEKAGEANAFVNAIFFLTIAGGLINNKIFEPTVDKFYSVVLLRSNPREYAVSDFLYFIIRTFIGFFVFSIVFGLICKVNFWVCLLIPFFVCEVKICITSLLLHIKTCKNQISDKKINTYVTILSLILLLLGVVLPSYSFSVNSYVLAISTAVLVIPSAFLLKYIWNYQRYLYLYKKTLNPSNFIGNKTQADTKKYWRKSIKINDKVVDVDTKSNKKGYKYFNELFMSRHSGLLTKTAKITSLVIISVFVLVSLICKIFSLNTDEIRDLLINQFTLLVLIVYFCNSGGRMTQAMFINCDHSMLAYRFYRQPNAILSLFKLRLKYVALVNLMPSLAMAIGYSILLYTCGSAAPQHYILAFLSLTIISVFFSVHNMVLYYLFQPYTENMEIKSFLFSIIKGVTYIVCYIFSQIKMPFIIFTSVSLIFCIIYIFVSLILVKKFAPKTFKLRQ